MERIPWTNQEQDKYYLYHGHHGFIAENHTVSLGLRPRDRVVFRDKSLVTVV